MADEKDLYTKTLDSFVNIVRNEMALIDLNATFNAEGENLSEEDRKKGADAAKEELFKLLREDHLQPMIQALANKRRAGWKRVKVARARLLEDHAATLRAAAEKDAKNAGVGAGLEVIDEPEGATGGSCPPGFIKVEGICVPV